VRGREAGEEKEGDSRVGGSRDECSLFGDLFGDQRTDLFDPSTRRLEETRQGASEETDKREGAMTTHQERGRERVHNDSQPVKHNGRMPRRREGGFRRKALKRRRVVE
jgi:hypothetical protein